MRRVRDLGEFELIERIEAQVQRAGAGGKGASGVRLGIGDDAALLRVRSGEECVVTTDTLVEDVHFRFENQSPRCIGRRTLRANLSDLAAMGARPLGFVLALALPPALPLSCVDGLVRGLSEDARRYACPLVGGNLTRARETSLAVTALGEVPAGRALRRGRARAGDRLFVTGELGGAALARARAERGGRLRHLPEPRLEAGQALRSWAQARRGPGPRRRVSCIDISDGLGSDLGHLLAGTGLGAELLPERLPRPRGFDAACRRLALEPATLLASGGEDYELLFSAGPGKVTASALARRLKLPVTEIGTVSAQPGLRGLRGLGEGGGWRHF